MYLFVILNVFEPKYELYEVETRFKCIKYISKINRLLILNYLLLFKLNCKLNDLFAFGKGEFSSIKNVRFNLNGDLKT